MITENLNEVDWHILFSQGFEELAKCSQNMSCGQCDVSKCLAYRHILKSRNWKRKAKKFSFSKLDLSLSVRIQSAVLLPPVCDGRTSKLQFLSVLADFSHPCISIDSVPQCSIAQNCSSSRQTLEASITAYPSVTIKVCFIPKD